MASEDDVLSGVRLSPRQIAWQGNAGFLLNVPPARDGLIDPADAAVLSELGRRVRDLRSRRLPGRVRVSSGTLTSPGLHLGDGLDGVVPWWRPDATGHRPLLDIRPAVPVRVEYVVLKEAIGEGQRVESVVVQGFLRGGVGLSAHSRHRRVPADHSGGRRAR